MFEPIAQIYDQVHCDRSSGMTTRMNGIHENPRQRSHGLQKSYTVAIKYVSVCQQGERGGKSLPISTPWWPEDSEYPSVIQLMHNTGMPWQHWANQKAMMPFCLRTWKKAISGHIISTCLHHRQLRIWHAISRRHRFSLCQFSIHQDWKQDMHQPASQLMIGILVLALKFSCSLYKHNLSYMTLHFDGEKKNINM